VEEADAALLAALGRLDGVTQVSVEPAGRYTLIWLDSAAHRDILPQVTACCAAQHVLLLDVQKRTEPMPSFAGPARLERLRTSAMVLALLRCFQGSHQSALLQQDHHGSAVRLHLELAELIQGVRCHRLVVGPLAQMVELVQELGNEAS
jgi:hypothetical protein